MLWVLSWIAWHRHHSMGGERASTGYMPQLRFLPSLGDLACGFLTVPAPLNLQLSSDHQLHRSFFVRRGESVVHSVVQRRRPSVASVLVVIFAAIIIIAATLLTFELMTVEAGLDDADPLGASYHSRAITL
jgi:hypothetical protein